jgi:rubrerythrin
MKYRFAPAELDTSDQTSLDPALNKHMDLHHPVRLISPAQYWRCPTCGQHTFDAEAVVCPFCQAAVTWQPIDSG